MTQLGKYFNYQDAGTGAPHFGSGRSAPALTSMRAYFLKRWGGMDLGIYGYRAVRGGTNWSTHASGAAWDWRWLNPGPGRAILLNEVFPLLIDHSGELGVQAIHDYVGGQIWHADRNAWKPQVKSLATGMGYASSQWIHTEIHPDFWADGRQVEERLGLDPEAAGWPPFDPADGLWGLYPVANKPIIKLGATGDLVKYMQGVLRVRLGYAIGVDGQWGPITNNFVIWFQTTERLTVDGICGPKTWARIDAYAA